MSFKVSSLLSIDRTKTTFFDNRVIILLGSTFITRDVSGVEFRRRYYVDIVAAIFGTMFSFLMTWLLITVIFPVEASDGLSGMLSHYGSARVAIPVFFATFVSVGFIILVRLIDMLLKPYTLRLYVKGQASPYCVYGSKKKINEWYNEINDILRWEVAK